ncbi:MAG: DUF459 domain-containing protein [Actinomycetota bacterium]|nr:DUF459 domain-containing protein [Actinomycetota bacterium]
MSAGRILGVGLVAFGAWFLFDARQLYQSAVTAPIGVRRSVSLAITGPVARIEEALGLDRLVNGVNRAVGKTGTPGGSAVLPPPAPTSTTRPPTPTTAPRGRTTTTVPGGTVTTTRPPSLAALRSPSAAHPLTILDIGDSIGEDLGIGLANVLAGAPHVTVIQASVGDTGLANIGYYDWLAELPREIARYHPEVVVVMLGGNDAQSFAVGSSIAELGTAEWSRVYSQRVGQLMSEATASGARVLWVGMPIMGPTSGLSNTDMARENSIYAAQARSHPGVTFASTWKLFEDPSGQYSTYLEVPGSGLVQVRDSDEIHIDPPGGTNLVATYAVHEMERTWHVSL